MNKKIQKEMTRAALAFAAVVIPLLILVLYWDLIGAEHLIVKYASPILIPIVFVFLIYLLVTKREPLLDIKLVLLTLFMIGTIYTYSIGGDLIGCLALIPMILVIVLLLLGWRKPRRPPK